MSERRVIHGDCLEALAELDDCSVDAVVADPPYGIGFMGHEWDQPGEYGPVRANGTPGLPNVHHGRGRRFRASQPAPSGHELEGGGAMAAGRYDLSYSANQRFQAWVEAWAVECLRVLKPGGYLVAFGGTRTYHRLASGIEDAGFEVRDTLAWMFGSGFPKSLDVSKAIDARLGVSREVIGTETIRGVLPRSDNATWELTAPAASEAAEWEGWGTALKPAFEPIVMARKPLVGTVAANVLEHGVGAINIDGCRIATSDDLGGGAELDVQADKPEGWDRPWRNDADAQAAHVEKAETFSRTRAALGRWPANVLLSHHEDCVLVGRRTVQSNGHFPAARPGGVEIGTVGHSGQEGLDERHTRGEVVDEWACVEGCPVRMLDEQTGVLTSGMPGTMRKGVNDSAAYGAESRPPGTPMTGYGDAGGASRFFYCAKTSRAERNAGLDELPDREGKTTSTPTSTIQNGRTGGVRVDAREYVPLPRKNPHPTVKPIAVMRWLIRLVTPAGGLIVDPFAGSGSTLCAAALEDVSAVGIDRQADYVAVMAARVRFWEEHGEDGLRIVRERDAAMARREAIAAAGQLELL